MLREEIDKILKQTSNRRFLPLDKQEHFIVGGVLGAMSYSLVYKETNSQKQALIWGVATGILIGLGKEIMDHGEANNHFDAVDWLATGVGSTSMALSIKVFSRKGYNRKHGGYNRNHRKRDNNK